MTIMRAAVLFSGIGGWEIACEWNGIDVVWSAEWDDWKRARYLERWPHATLFRDVAEIDGRDAVREHGPIDILLASPPCTDISAANAHGAGIDGGESRYYLEAIRLARETGARWIGFENSPRLRTRGADRVLALLEEAGYALWPCVVEAEDAGAPHERGRSFVVGCRRDALEGADTERRRLWIEQGWRGWTDGSGAAVAQAHADPDREGQLNRAEHGREMAGRAGADGDVGSRHLDVALDGQSLGRGQGWTRRPAASPAREQNEQCSRPPTSCHADRARLAERQGVGRNPFEKFTPLERAALCPWDHGGDGLAGYLLLVDGLGERLRSHGLSERAVKAELARWRSALGDALVIPVVVSVVRAIVRTDRQWMPAPQRSTMPP